MTAYLSDTEYAVAQVQREFVPTGEYIECRDGSEDRNTEYEYVSQLDLWDSIDATIDNDRNFTPYIYKDPSICNAMSEGSEFQYKGRTVRRLGKVWTFCYPEQGDVVAKCIGTRGNGCQHRNTFRAFVGTTDGYAVPSEERHHELQLLWLRAIFSHGVNCPGRRTKYNSN